MSLFYKLERKFEETDIELYGIVNNGLCKNVKFGEAHLIFEKLFVIGLHPNVVIYTTMINGFCQEGLLDKAKDILRKMEDNLLFAGHCNLQRYYASISQK